MKSIQYGWQACSKCGDLIYTDRTLVPTCKAGGEHATFGNTNRGVANVPNTWIDNFPDGEEPNWRFCSNCHGLFRIYGDAGAVNHGICNHAKVGTAHVIAAGSSFYILETKVGEPSAAEAAVAYYECSKCGSLFHDWTVTACNAGGQHEKFIFAAAGKYFY